MTPLDAAREGKELDRLKTQGQWVGGWYDESYWVETKDEPVADTKNKADTQFIAHAGTHYATICQALIDAVEALEKVKRGLCYPDEYFEVAHNALAAIKGEKP